MSQFQRNRGWIEALKGAIILIIGIICLVNPSEALTAIAIYLGIIAAVAGVIILVNSLTRKGAYWRFWAIEGGFNLLIGLLMISYPKVAVQVIIVFISLWILALSIIQTITYSHLSKSGYRSPVMLFTAILSLLTGLLLLFNPFDAAKVVAIVFGIYALVQGISSLVVAYRLLTR